MNTFANAIRAMDSPAFRVHGGIFSGLALRHVVLALVFTAGYNILGQLGWLGSADLSLVLRLKKFVEIPFKEMPLHLAIASFAILAAVAADNTLSSGAARWLRYPLAVLIAALAGGVLIDVLTPPVAERGAKVVAALAQLGDVYVFQIGRRFLSALYISTLVVALYAVLETSHRASLALHAAQLRALIEQRDVCAAELSAMQARVDPDLLFESLRLVDEAYGTDSALGQARLDALIRFLRAALPSKSGVNSTVRQEQELVEAYVALVAADIESTPRPFFQTRPELLDESVPPMILLPTVRWATAGASADGLTIFVERCDTPSAATLLLKVGNHVPNAAETSGEEIQIVKERLEGLYGSAAEVTVSAAKGQRLATVEFPADSSRRSDSQAPLARDRY